MDSSSPLPQVPGQPRTEADAALLARFDARMRLPIVIGAVLPLIIVPESGNPVGAVVGVVSWIVFLVDYVVHQRRLVHYTGTGRGRFDLAVVVLTTPWYLLTGGGGGDFVLVLRLARLARLAVASRGARQLVDRLGRMVAVASGVVVLASFVAYRAEHPSNPEFATYGDALWWGVVTLTTVGYGDIVPKTASGRFAGVTIMITGISVLGLLSGSLASFFNFGSADSRDDSASKATPTEPAGALEAGTGETLAREIAELREQMVRLTEQLVRVSPHD